MIPVRKQSGVSPNKGDAVFFVHTGHRDYRKIRRHRKSREKTPHTTYQPPIA